MRSGANEPEANNQQIQETQLPQRERASNIVLSYNAQGSSREIDRQMNGRTDILKSYGAGRPISIKSTA